MKLMLKVTNILGISKLSAWGSRDFHKKTKKKLCTQK